MPAGRVECQVESITDSMPVQKPAWYMLHMPQRCLMRRQTGEKAFVSEVWCVYGSEYSVLGVL